MQRLASRIARGLNRLLGRGGRYFRDRFHCCVVRSSRQARNLLAYVLLNEHKDRAKQGVRVGGIDTYSSGVFFDGWAGSFARPLSGEAPAAEQAPVTAPKSWLLRVGWRRHGLVRTTEKAPNTAVLLRSQSRAFSERPAARGGLSNGPARGAALASRRNVKTDLRRRRM